MSRESAAEGLLRYLEDVTDAPEVLWAAGLSIVRRAVDEAEEARHGRFAVYPHGLLRRFRRDVAGGLGLMRLAANMCEAERELTRELDEELQQAAVAAARARRRAQTLPAERARLAKRLAKGGGGG